MNLLNLRYSHIPFQFEATYLLLPSQATFLDLILNQEDLFCTQFNRLIKSSE